MLRPFTDTWPQELSHGQSPRDRLKKLVKLRDFPTFGYTQWNQALQQRESTNTKTASVCRIHIDDPWMHSPFYAWTSIGKNKGLP